MLSYNLRYEWVVYDNARNFEDMGWYKGESICSCHFGSVNDLWYLCYFPQGKGRRKTNPVLRLCRETSGVPMKLEGYLSIKPDDERGDETILVNTSIQKLSTFVNLPLNLARYWRNLNDSDLDIEINIRATEISTNESDINRGVNSTQVQQKAVQTDVSGNLNVPSKRIATTAPSTSSNLSRHMQAMYEKKDQTDLVLKCKSSDFPVHKCVLSARSPVFRSMFQHSMIESTKNRVTITDIEPCVLDQLISFIYTGRVNALSYPMARDLYSAADKYAILDLKDICCQFIISSLSTSKAVEILILADKHNDKLLKDATVSFIATNFEELNTTQAWFSLLRERPPLGIEVLSLTMTHLKSTRQNPK